MTEVKDKSYLLDQYNNRPYDPFHKQKLNQNINNIEMITQDIIDYYIIKPECWTCTGDAQPRPMDCCGTPECKFKFGHGRAKDANGENKKNVSIECRSKKGNMLTIELSRPNLSFNYYNQLKFIFRTDGINNTVMHHKNGIKNDDTPGNHSVQYNHYHLTVYHSEISKMIRHITKSSVKMGIEKPDNLYQVLLKMFELNDNPIIMGRIREIELNLERSRQECTGISDV